jgi:hypothetical protein
MYDQEQTYEAEEREAIVNESAQIYEKSPAIQRRLSELYQKLDELDAKAVGRKYTK